MIALATIGLYIALFTFLFLFSKKTIDIAYKLHNNKKQNNPHEENFRLFAFYKISSYTINFIIILCAMFVSHNVILKGWIYIFYLLCMLSLLFVRINISLIDHLLNIMYIKEYIELIEKEYLIGAVEKENNRYYFKYRLTRDKFCI